MAPSTSLRGVPALGGLLDLDDLEPERRHERPVGHLVRELGALAVQLLDLAADVGQLRLDLEQVGDLARALARSPGARPRSRRRFRMPCLEVHELAADLGRLRLLARRPSVASPRRSSIAPSQRAAGMR